MYGFDPPNEATSKKAIDGKVNFNKPRKVYNNFTSQNSEAKVNRVESDLIHDPAKKNNGEKDLKQSAYTHAQRPNTSGKSSKANQIEQSDNNTDKGNGSNRSSRMIK